MPFVNANAIDLYYETHGAGPAVVLAHGRSGNHLSWWQQVPYFSRHCQVVTFDHRGFGQSLEGAHGPGRAMFVTDLQALLDDLRLERVSIVGQSMGGWTALGFAVQYPDRVHRLVLADTTAGIVDPRIARAYATRGPPPDDFVERALSPNYRQEQPAGTFLYSRIAELNPPWSEPLSTLLLSSDGPTADALAKLSVQTLFIVGEHDPVVSPQMAQVCAGLLPHARVEVFAGAGHSVYFEQPEQFNSLVFDFLSGTHREGPA